MPQLSKRYFHALTQGGIAKKLESLSTLRFLRQPLAGCFFSRKRQAAIWLEMFMILRVQLLLTPKCRPSIKPRTSLALPTPRLRAITISKTCPVGTYNVSVSMVGFAKSQFKGVEIKLNTTITQNVTLSVSESTTTVDVQDAVAAIDTTTAQLWRSFDVKQVTDLPSTATGSGVLNLSLLNAGVATSGAVGAGTGTLVAGQRPRNNDFTVEGIRQQ